MNVTPSIPSALLYTAGNESTPRTHTVMMDPHVTLQCTPKRRMNGGIKPYIAHTFATGMAIKAQPTSATLHPNTCFAINTKSTMNPMNRYPVLNAV